MFLTDEEAELIKRVSEIVNVTSEYCCMSRMFIEEIKNESNNQN